MKATITIVRKIVEANKKEAKEKPFNYEETPAISIKTYLGTIHAKEVYIEKGLLTQSIEEARCNGATVFITCEFEDLIIDGIKANKEMFNK